MVFSLCFWSLIVVSTYTANLASVLIAKQQPSYPASSLAEAERKGVPICVTKDFANAGKIKRDYPKTNLVEVDGITMTYEFLQEGKCDLVADGFSTFDRVKRNQTINPDCSLEWIGRVEYVSSGGPACVVDAGFLCTSLVGHVIEYYMKEMEYDGFLDSAFENFLDSISNHQCLDLDDSGDEEESSRLTLVDMGGIFVTHGIACVLALLVSFFQRWWDNRHQQDQEQDAKTSEKNSEEGNSMLARQIGSGDFEMEPVPESHITFTVK